MKNYQLPSRYEPMNSVSDICNNFDVIKSAIRPEARNEVIINKAQTAISVGLNDAAVNYFWNLTMHDLYTKIIAYGVEYFASAINWQGEPLRSIDGLREIKDYQIIEGCYQLGIISSESYFFMNQCREIRNNFSTAHLPIGEIDILETGNFVKNCIKYVLTFDPPLQGIKIKDLIDFMNSETCNEETEALILQQAPKVWNAIIFSIFEQFIKQDCSSIFKSNAKIIAPVLWGNIPDDVKACLGQRFVKLKAIAGQDAANEAFAFLQIVNGMSFIPEDNLFIIFEKASKRLIDAHFAFENFYNEPSCARDLLSIGTTVPISIVKQYVKAIILSYNGNCYGIARAAQNYNEIMINSFSATAVREVFNLLGNDKDIIRELTNSKPCSRLKELMSLIAQKTMIPEHKKKFEIIVAADIHKLRDSFLKRYNEILDSEERR